MTPFSRISALAGYLLAWLLLSAGSSFGDSHRLYVKQTGGDDDLNDGRSWGSAYKTFAKALREADDNGSIEEIWLADGTYGPDGNYSINDPENVFKIDKPIKVYGGFKSDGSQTNLRDRDFARNTTGNEFHLQYAGHSATPTIFQGVADKRVLRTRGNVTLDGVTIQQGDSPDDGGGIYVESGSVILNRIKFTDNAAVGVGGGLFLKSGKADLSWCIFEQNQASDAGGAAGVGDTATGIKLVNSQFINNTAQKKAGACFFQLASWQFYGCLFKGSSVLEADPIATSMEMKPGGSFRFCSFEESRGSRAVYAISDLEYFQSIYDDDASKYLMKDSAENSLVSRASGAALPLHQMDLDGDGIVDEEWLYDLDGYLRDDTFGAISTVKVQVKTATISVEYKAAETSLELDFSESNQDSIANATGIGIKRVDTTTTLKIASVPEHWKFKQWTDDTGSPLSSADYDLKVPANDTNILAEFEPEQYFLQIVKNPNQGISDEHRSFVWGRNTVTGLMEDDTQRKEARGNVLIRESTGQETNSTEGNFFQTPSVTLEANASEGYQLLGWVIMDSNDSAKQAANNLLNLFNAGSAIADDNSTHGGTMVAGTYYTANPLAVLFDSNKSIVPIFEAKLFEFDVVAPVYDPDDLNVSAAVYEDSINSEPGQGLWKRKVVTYSLPEGWELDLNATQVGGKSWLYWEEYHDLDFNHSMDTLSLTLQLRPEMKTPVHAQLAFKPVSYEVVALPGEFLLVDRNSTLPPLYSIINGNGLELSDGTFREGSDVLIELGFKPEFAALKSKVDVNWRWTMEDGHNLPVTGEFPHNPRMSILGLKGKVVAYYDVSVKSFYFKHKIYFREPTPDDPDPPYVIEKSLHLSGDKVFIPEFPVKDGYIIKHLDENGSDIFDVNTSSLQIRQDEDYPEDRSLDHFLINDSNITIVSIYEPRTYQLELGTVYQEGGVKDWNASPGGKVWLLPDSPTRKYRFGDRVQLDAVPDSGYDFLEWSDGEMNKTRLVDISDDHNFTAVFGLRDKDVHLSFTGKGEFFVDDVPYGSGASLKRPYNRSFAVRAIPSLGYRFDGALRLLDSSSLEEVDTFGTRINSMTKMEQVDANFTVLRSLKVVANFIPDDGDYDGDGVSNYDESLYGTRHDLNDTDGDKIPDYWEVIDWNRLREENATYNDSFWEDARNNRYAFRDLNKSLRYPPGNPPALHLDPLKLDDSVDLDFDNVSNYDEFLSRANPIDPETVSDGDVDQPTVAFLEDLGAAEQAASKINQVVFRFKLDSNMTIETSEGNLTLPAPPELAEVNQNLDENRTVKFSTLTVFEPRKIRLSSVTPGFLFTHWQVVHVSSAGDGGILPPIHDSSVLDYQPLEGHSMISLHFVRDDNDSDADGLSNYEERYLYETNASSPDTDKDGILDGFEIANGLDPKNNLERVVLDLVETHHADLHVVLPKIISPSADSNSSVVESNSTSPIASDGNYTAGFQKGREEVLDLWSDFNSSDTDYQDGYAVGRSEVLVSWTDFNGTFSDVRIDLYRFIAADKGSLLSTVTAADKGWFYTPAHGWSWLSPDVDRAGFVYNAEVNSWVWLNPSVGSGVTGSFGQFIGLDGSGNPTYGDYPFTSNLQDTPPTPTTNPGGSGGSSGSSSPSTQDTGFGNL